jgi:transposase
VAEQRRRQYTAQERAEVVRLIQASKKSLYAMSKDLGIPESTLGNWLRQAKVDAGAGKPGELTSEERSELNRLRRENRTLKQEREFLKKAAAFFAKENGDDSK